MPRITPCHQVAGATTALATPEINHLKKLHPVIDTAPAKSHHSTQGDITLINTGQFLRELSRRNHTFVHNSSLRCPTITTIVALPTERAGGVSSPALHLFECSANEIPGL